MDWLPVFDMKEVEKEAKENDLTVLITARNAKSIYQIIEQMENIGVKNIGIIKSRAENYCLDIDLEKGTGITWYLHNNKKENVIPRIELNLVDGCNLNCLGCTHFASLYPPNSVYNIKDYKRDLNRLKEIGLVHRLRLLGGEPFLLENIEEYIQIARDIFPETDIEVVSNGLLIPDVSKEKLKIFKQSNVGIVISAYKPTIRIKRKIEKVLNENEVWWKFVGDEIDTFSRRITLSKTHNAEISHKNCISVGCIMMRKGRIFKCSAECFSKDFCAFYHIKEMEGYEGLDIYGEKEDLYEKIRELSMYPVEMCRYCAEIPEEIPWSCNANPTLEDWLYKREIH